jgi:hypothetical protein
VVTVRAYNSAAEAALAKSLLDDYEIECALADENTHLYVPYAVPVRLVVNESDAERAQHILDGHPEEAADGQSEFVAAESFPTDRRKPWELLAIAFAFLLPAICVLQIKAPAKFSRDSMVRREIATVDVYHLLAWLGIIFAAFLVVLYVWVTRSARNVAATPESNAPGQS